MPIQVVTGAFKFKPSPADPDILIHKQKKHAFIWYLCFLPKDLFECLFKAYWAYLDYLFIFISCLCQALDDLPLGQIKTDAILGGLCPSRRSFVYTYLLNFNSTRSLLSSLSVPMKLNATTKRQLRFDLIEHTWPAPTRGLGLPGRPPLGRAVPFHSCIGAFTRWKNRINHQEFCHENMPLA